MHIHDEAEHAGGRVARAIDAAMEALVVPSFSRIGHAVRGRLFGWTQPEPGTLGGRMILITGATSGLGHAAARNLARAGASVRLIGRNPQKLERVSDEIRRDIARSDVGSYVADMSDMNAVRRVAALIREREPHVDVLINNAGSLLTERVTSPDGHESTFATMVLGPFILTNELLPIMSASHDGRVVIVTSGGMYTQGLHLDDLETEHEPYRGTVAYARAKRIQVLLTRLWAERTRGTSVVVHAMHPGWADTPGVEGSLPGFRKVMRPLLRSPDEGADTMVWLAAAEEPTRSTGRLWLDRRPRAFDRLSRTRVGHDEALQLWARLATITGTDYAEPSGQ